MGNRRIEVIEEVRRDIYSLAGSFSNSKVLRPADSSEEDSFDVGSVVDRFSDKNRAVTFKSEGRRRSHGRK